MKRFSIVFLIVLLVVLAACSGNGQHPDVIEDIPPVVNTSQAEVDINPTPIPLGTYEKHIVVLNPGLTQLDRDTIASGLTKTASHIYNTVFVGFAADISQSELDSLTADNRVAFVEEDSMFYLCNPTFASNPNDDLWGIRNDLAPTVFTEPSADPIPNYGSNTADWGVSRMNAFPSPGLQGDGITVAIIDTGIDNDHLDLAGAIVAEYDAIDDIAGVGTANDMRGHGTHVAGIVGARDNDIHTVGVAPLCSLAGIQVFPDSGGGTPSSVIIRGIDWMAANHNLVTPPIKVANMSLSGTGTGVAYHAAIQAVTDLGITVVVAAGNDFRDAAQQKPANFDNVITVSAMKRVWNAGSYDYRFAAFSNWGNTVDIIAPGQAILSLYHNGATASLSGTSMASPHVAGLAALYLDSNPADGFAEVKAALLADGETGTWIGDPDGIYEPLARVLPQSWHTLELDTAGRVGEFSSLALVDGNPAISYYDGTSTDLKYVRATNSSGTNWGTPVVVDMSDDDGLDTSLAIVDGNPAISYWDRANADLKYVRATDATGTAWGTPVVVDTAGDVGWYTSLTMVNGNPAISYWDRTNADLKYVRANDASGTAWGTPVAVDAAGSNGEYTSLAVVNGNPAISYQDATNGDLKFVRATDASGTAWGAPLALDTGGVVGLYTSLELVDGNPAISYFDLTNDLLKYVRATDASGSTWGTAVAVDAAGNSGEYTSLAVVGGNPAISYYDGINADLKYVRATDITGSTWGTPLVLDTTGVVGLYTSLAVVDGNPAISYYDFTNFNLKYTYFGS